MMTGIEMNRIDHDLSVLNMRSQTRLARHSWPECCELAAVLSITLSATPADMRQEQCSRHSSL